MNELFVSGVGAVLSADIAVPDHPRAARFYSRVLSTGDAPLWREDLMNSRGTPIIGLGARTADYAALPVQWMPHIQVADVEASARRASELAGTVLMRSDGEDAGASWAVLLDPNGAAFGIIPVVPADRLPAGGGPSAGPVGRIAWLDLTVPEAGATRDFYLQVVGWSVQDVDMEDGEERYADFNMLSDDGTPAAGVCHARGANAGLPPVWMIYLPVGDLDESLRRAEEEGGTILRTIRARDGAYQYVAVQDPAGAYLALVQG